MTDAELQKKYPFPPEMQELAETMLNGGKPVARPAALGVEQMQAILNKLREDKVKLLNAIEENDSRDFSHKNDDARYDACLAKTFEKDLAELNREIADYEKRLQEYETQKKGLN